MKIKKYSAGRALRVWIYLSGSVFISRQRFRILYFLYNGWKDRSGSNPEQFMDIETIKRWLLMRRKIKIIRKASLFELSAQRNDLDSWVEIGLLLTDPEIEELFNPQKGIVYYEKTAQQNHPSSLE